MYNSYCCPLSKMVLRIHGKDESVVRFRQGAPSKYTILDTIRIEDFLFDYIELF